LCILLKWGKFIYCFDNNNTWSAWGTQKHWLLLKMMGDFPYISCQKRESHCFPIFVRTLDRKYSFDKSIDACALSWRSGEENVKIRLWCNRIWGKLLKGSFQENRSSLAFVAFPDYIQSGRWSMSVKSRKRAKVI